MNVYILQDGRILSNLRPVVDEANCVIYSKRICCYATRESNIKGSQKERSMMKKLQKPRNGLIRLHVSVENYEYLLIRAIAQKNNTSISSLLLPSIYKFLEDYIKDTKSKK